MHVDQRRRRPGRVGEALSQALPDIAFGFDHQTHENGIEQSLDIGVAGRANGLGGFAKLDYTCQQPFSIARIAAARQ